MVLASAGGRWVTSDALEFDLWRDRPPRSPRSALQLVVSRLRDALDDRDHEIIRSGTNGYRLDLRRVEIDLLIWTEHVARSRRLVESGRQAEAAAELEQARALWRGTPLAPMDSSEILDNERFRLIQARLDALVLEGRILADFGRPGDAIHCLAGAGEHVHYREDVAVLLMRSYAATNRRADGLQVANTARRHLRSELGISPSADFEAAEAVLLESGRSTPEPGPTVELRRRPQWRQAFFDRILGLVLDELASGKPRVLIVEGPARSGRSTLLGDLSSGLEAAGRTVLTVGRELGESHTLRRLVAENELRSAHGQLAEHVLLLDELERFGGSGGLALLIDDAGHLDHWSTAFLARLSRSSTLMVAVLATSTQSGERDASEAMEAAIRHTMPPLAMEDVEAELAAALGSGLRPSRRQQLAREILTWSGGDAATVLQAIEVLGRDLDAVLPLPATRRSAVGRRLAGLEERWIEIVRAAAVLDVEIDPILVSAVVERPVEEVITALSAFDRTGLVVPSRRPGRRAFADGVTQAILAEPVDELTSLRHHDRAGRWLLEHSDRLAAASRHLLAALPLGSSDAASSAARAGGRELFQGGQYQEAAELLELAVHLIDDPVERAQVRYEQAVALEWSGRIEDADEIFTSVVEQAAVSEDHELLAAAALAGGGHSGRIGGQEHRRQRLQLAASRLPDGSPMNSRVAVELAYERWAARLPLEPATVSEVERQASTAGAPAHLLARRLVLWWRDLIDGVDLPDAHALAADALSVRQDDIQHMGETVKCLLVAAGVAQAHGALSAVEEWLDEIDLVGRRTGMPQARWQPVAFRASLEEMRGLPTAADATAERALAIGTSLDITDALPTFMLHHLGRALLSGGLGSLAGPVEEAADRLRFPVWYAIKGLAALDVGDEAAARQSLGQMRLDSSDDRDYFRIQALALGALLATRLDRPEEGLAATDALSSHEGRLLFLGHGGPFLGPIDWYRAQPVAAFGDPTEGARLAAAADELTTRAGADAWLRSELRAFSPI